MGSLILSSQEYQEYASSKFENSFGTIVDDIVVIYQYGTIIPIRIEHLVKVSFYKKRNYFFNFICFVSAIICVLAIVFIETTSLCHLILVGIFIIAVILAFKTKWIEYSFLVVRFNLNFIELKVRSNQKDEAEELVKLINEKLKGRSESFISDKLIYRAK
jgi:hypothetical protein